jgi:hypothetical protein
LTVRTRLWTLIGASVVITAACKDYVGPLGGEPPATVGGAVTLVLGGINSATGARVSNSAGRCAGSRTGTCVECTGVVMSMGASGTAGSTAVLDSARYQFLWPEVGRLAETKSVSRADVRDLWGRIELTAGNTYTSEEQTLISDLPFTVRRTVFFRSGDAARRDSAFSTFSCQ